jgi:chemotaxis protein MotB
MAQDGAMKPEERAPRRAAAAFGRFAVLLLPLTCGACVRETTYEVALANLAQARGEADRNGAQAAALAARVPQLDAEITRLGAEIAARDVRLGELTLVRANDAKKVDDLVALNSELSQRLRSVGQSIETLVGEKGSLAKALADTRTRLEELRRQQAAAEARAAQFRDLLSRFRKLIDAGQLKVVMRGGRMLIELANDVLFDSGKTEIKDVGKKTLGEIASVLKTMPDRRFQVAGHTDNVKIQTARYPSNWELSTARAVEVVKLLIGAGMDPQHLSAGGYGEFAPVDSNDTGEGRMKNRRIEIALVPNLEELVSLPAVEATAAAPAASPTAPHR